MTLSEEDRKRLADVVELQPTKNAELQDRWDLESGSDVHRYLESSLGEYYYRDDDSLIRATAEAATLVDVEPGVSGDDGDGPDGVRVPPLEATILSVLPGPTERGHSVVSVVHSLEEEDDVDAEPDAVRSGLRRLQRKGVVAVDHRTVPTFRLAVDLDGLEVAVAD